MSVLPFATFFAGLCAGLRLAKWRRNRSQRRRHFRDEPFDDGHYDFLDLD